MFFSAQRSNQEPDMTPGYLKDSDGSALEPLIRKLAYRQRLSAEDRAALRALPHSVKRFEPHHYIVREREVATHSCLMVS
jgi:hypothetical protein